MAQQRRDQQTTQALPWALVVGALLLVCGHAAAQPGVADEAAAHVTAAKGHYRAKRFAPAAVEFEAALRLQPDDPATNYNLARCRERLEQLPQAVQRYEAYLRLAPTAGDAATVRRHKAKLEARLGRDHGRLSVVTEPPGATVLLSGATPSDPPQPLGVAPLHRWLAAGTHEVQLKLEGFEGVTRQTTLAANARVTLEATLRPRPTVGQVTLSCAVAGAKVFVDGEPRGTTPLAAALELPPGAHHLRVSKEGHTAWEQDLKLSAGDSVGLTAALAPSATPVAAVAAAPTRPEGDAGQPAEAPSTPGPEAPEATPAEGAGSSLPPDEPAGKPPAEPEVATADPAEASASPVEPTSDPVATPTPTPSGGLRTPSGWAWTLLGTGLAGLAVGVGSAWAFHEAESSAQDYHAAREDGTRDEYDRRVSRTETFGLAANLGFGVAAAGLSAGLLLWWLEGDDGPPDTAEALRQTPTAQWALGPAGASLRLQW